MLYFWKKVHENGAAVSLLLERRPYIMQRSVNIGVSCLPHDNGAGRPWVAAVGQPWRAHNSGHLVRQLESHALGSEPSIMFGNLSLGIGRAGELVARAGL